MKPNMSLWILSLALQALLLFGLAMSWVDQGKALRSPLSRAAEETVSLKLKEITDSTAKAIIGGQHIRIQGLIDEQEAVRQFTGYMAILSIGSMLVTLLLMIVSRNKSTVGK
jgi:hypothetical protein